MEFHLKGYKLKDKQIIPIQMLCEKIVGIALRQDKDHKRLWIIVWDAISKVKHMINVKNIDGSSLLETFHQGKQALYRNPGLAFWIDEG